MKPFLKLIILILILAACNDSKKQGAGSEVSPQSDIERIKLTDLNGTSISMKHYKGKTVFINFWATWCRPCIAELPSIKNAKDSFSDKDILFLFASDEDKEEIEAFASQHDYVFKYVKAQNLEDLHITGLPTTFIFNREGKLAFAEMGARQWDSKESIALITKVIKP